MLILYNRSMKNITERTNNGQDQIVIDRAEYEELLRKSKENDALRERVDELEKANNWFAEQLTRAKNRMYGKHSEKATDEVLDQLSLFDEAEMTVYLEELQRETVKVSEHTRVAKNARAFTMDNLPENIEVETEEHRLPPEERICEYCGSEMTEIGKEIVRTLKFLPARVIIHEDWYYSYTCKKCNGDDEKAEIIETPHVPSFYPGSFASAEAAAHIMYEKFVMGAPLYRQEQDLKRKEINLSRQTMSNWILHASEKWLKPVYEVLHRELLTGDILHADETTLQVLREPGKTADSKSYMWLYRTGKYAERPIVLYEYQPGRGGGNPAEFLKGFRGYLQTDGYSGYNALPDVIHVGCLAHLKRKFHEAVLVLPKNNRKGTAVQGEAYCSRLCEIEQKLSGLTPEERYTERLRLEKPILDEFLAWGRTRQASEKSTLGKALIYLHNQGSKISNYLLDGRLEATNNLAERSIKPFVIDRKNFLFANTPKGAEGSAVIFSLIETAKESGLNPFEYLTYVLKNAPIMEKKKLSWPELMTPAAVKQKLSSQI